MQEERHGFAGTLQSSSKGLLDLVLLMVHRKLIILGTALIFGVVFLGASYLRPNIYTATVRLVTPQDVSSSLSSSLAGLSDLASFAGISSQSLSSEQYIVFLKSRTVFDEVITKFDLMGFYDLDTREQAYQKLNETLTITPLENTNVVEIKVMFEDPVVAADIANFFLVQLKSLLIDLKNQSTEAELDFLRERLLKAEMDMVEAEKKLAKFQEETGFVQLDYQSKAIIETIAKLNTVLAEKIVMLKSLQTYQTENSSEVKGLKTQVAELETQIKALGQSGKISSDQDEQALSESAMQFTERMRDYNIREAIVNAVRKEFEMISLEKARTEASVQILDRAVPPEEKTSPKRLLILFLGLVIGALSAMIYLYIREGYQNAAPAYRNKVDMIRKEMFRFR